MRVKVYPSVVSGSITPPASKSLLHRSIICACMAKGESTIKNVIYSKDVEATLRAFESLGVKVIRDRNQIIIISDGYDSFTEDVSIDCNESGSTIRFLIPVLSNNKNAYFKGKSSLISRPMNIYEDIFNHQGLLFKRHTDYIETKGRISSGYYQIPGDISSQFISGLLFILPVLDGDSIIEITGNFESSSYVDMTVKILNEFGIKVEKIGPKFFVQGNQKYQNSSVKVESDYSQLAFFAVLGIVNNDIEIRNISSDSLQPDKQILAIIEQMGGLIEQLDDSLYIHRSQTTGITIDLSQCPDIGPILGVLAACSNGTTNIINAKRLVIKESNRLLSTYEVLKEFGVDVLMSEDSLTIHGSMQLNANELDSFNDHRMAMSIAIAATIASSPIIINRAEAIEKSYPTFYQDLASLGVRIEFL